MKTNWLFWLICLAGIALIIPAIANDRHNLPIEYHAAIKRNKQKVILLKTNHLNPQVSVYINGQLYSQQKGPNTLNSREFMVLGPFDQPTNVSISADFGFKLEAEYSPTFIDITPKEVALSSEQIEHYRRLYKASQLWNEKDNYSHQQAIELLQELLANPGISTAICIEASYLLSAMFFAQKKMQQGAKLLEGIKVNPLADWQLSELDSLLFNARGKYWQRDFEPAILLYCDYLKNADKRHQTHSKILLAQSLIERQRGVKPDKANKFKAQYHKRCGHVVTDLAGSEKLIEDGKKILTNLLLEHQYWPEPQLQSVVFGQLWNYYMVNSNHAKAEKMARLAIAYDVHVDQKLQSADYYWYLGTSLLRQGDFKQAQQVWREGLIKTGRADGEGLSATSLFNLAYSYFMVGEYGLSKRYFTQALAGDEKNEGPLNWQLGQLCNKDGIYSAMTIVRLGIIARIEGRGDDAMTMFNCAEAVFDNTNEYYALVAKLEIAKSHLADENIQLAKNYIDKVLNDKRLMQGLKIDGLLARLKVSMALRNDLEVETTANMLAMALDYDSVNFALAETHQNYPQKQIEFYRLLVRHYGQKAQLAKVTEFGEKALKLIQSIKAQVLNTQAWSAVQYEMLAEYIKALYGIDSSQNIDKIFALLDRYYAINLDISRSNNTEQSKLVTSEALSALWQEKLAADRALIGVSDDNKAIAMQEADVANEAFLAYRYDIEQSLGLTKHQPLSIAQIQALMPKTDVLLRYFVDQELSFVAVLTKDSFYFKQLSSQSQIRTWVSDILSSLSTRNILSQLKQSPLNELLPHSLLQTNHFERLVVIADDTLHQLPFSLLNGQKGSGYKALGASVKLVRTYSAQDFYRQQANGLGNNNDSFNIALFADPDFQQATTIVDGNRTSKAYDRFKQWLFEQPRLAHTKSEVDKIASLFTKRAGVGVLVASDKYATNEFLLSEQARSANILHIATHGYFDEQNPQLVGLLTAAVKGNGASYGFLGLPELLSKPFSNELVVVSACETMQGQYYKGSGNQNITRGLLAKGAQSVIGTLWKVADRPTSVFMAMFYQYLQTTGGDTALALQLTKQDFMSSGAYRHPLFWAGFVLTASSDALKLSM